MKKFKTIKLNNDHTQSRLDHTKIECLNTYVSVVPNKAMDSFIDFISNLYDELINNQPTESEDYYGKERR